MNVSACWRDQLLGVLVGFIIRTDLHRLANLIVQGAGLASLYRCPLVLLLLVFAALDH